MGAGAGKVAGGAVGRTQHVGVSRRFALVQRRRTIRVMQNAVLRLTRTRSSGGGHEGIRLSRLDLARHLLVFNRLGQAVIGAHIGRKRRRTSNPRSSVACLMRNRDRG